MEIKASLSLWLVDVLIHVPSYSAPYTMRQKKKIDEHGHPSKYTYYCTKKNSRQIERELNKNLSFCCNILAW